MQQIQTVLVVGLGRIYEEPLEKLSKRVGFSFQRLLHTYLAAGEKSVSAQQAFDLLELANQARREEPAKEYFLSNPPSFSEYRPHLSGTEFLRQFDSFLERYGHRGIYESDHSPPRYRDDPSPLLATIAVHVQAPSCESPQEIIERQQKEAAETWRQFEDSLSPWQRMTVKPRVKRLLRRIKQMYLWRERYRSEIVRVLAEQRRWYLELAKRFTERAWIEQPEDFFCLIREEVSRAIADGDAAANLRTIVQMRKAERAAWQQIEMPLLLRESELPNFLRRSQNGPIAPEGPQLRGLCVSAGYAEGEVVVLHEPTAIEQMKQGAILVAPATDPSWSPLFTLASGVIVEIGGTLSHASTVAREYGLPALANVRNATKLLKTGDRVRLDATNGFVEVLRDQISFHTTGN